MYCAACDRWEHDDLGIDTERCLRCGGNLCQPDDDFDRTLSAVNDAMNDEEEKL